MPLNDKHITKQDACTYINKYLSDNVLKAGKNGNVKFANKQIGLKCVYWINVHIDNRIQSDYYFILNDKNKREFTYLSIPANTLNRDLFKTRIDKTNGLEKLDIELSCLNLKDIKSGGTHFNFKKYMSKTFSY